MARNKYLYLLLQFNIEEYSIESAMITATDMLRADCRPGFLWAILVLFHVATSGNLLKDLIGIVIAS